MKSWHSCLLLFIFLCGCAAGGEIGTAISNPLDEAVQASGDPTPAPPSEQPEDPGIINAAPVLTIAPEAATAIAFATLVPQPTEVSVLQEYLRRALDVIRIRKALANARKELTDGK